MSKRDLILALGVILIWGLNFVFVKIGVEQFPPFLFMTLRFAIVAVLLLPFIRWPTGRFWPLFWYSLVLGNLHFSLMFNAIEQIDASTAALLIQLNTPFAVILSAVLLKDYPGWKRVAGITVAFLGCVLIAGEPRFDNNLLPILLIVGGTFAWAVANIQAKQLGDIDPFALNGWMAIMATPQLLILTYLFEDHQLDALLTADWEHWFAAVYQSVAVVILGYGIWYGLLKRYPVSRVVPLTLLLPIVGVAGGVLILGDQLTTMTIIGGLFIIAGVSVVALRQAAKAEAVDTKPS